MYSCSVTMHMMNLATCPFDQHSVLNDLFVHRTSILNSLGCPPAQFFEDHLHILLAFDELSLCVIAITTLVITQVRRRNLWSHIHTCLHSSHLACWYPGRKPSQKDAVGSSLPRLRAALANLNLQ